MAAGSSGGSLWASLGDWEAGQSRVNSVRRRSSVSVKSSTERIDQQANRCLFGTRAGIPHGVDFDDVHADQMTFGSYAFQQAVDFREAEAVGFQSSSAGSEGGVHYIHVEGDVDVSALR